MDKRLRDEKAKPLFLLSPQVTYPNSYREFGLPVLSRNPTIVDSEWQTEKEKDKTGDPCWGASIVYDFVHSKNLAELSFLFSCHIFFLQITSGAELRHGRVISDAIVVMHVTPLWDLGPKKSQTTPVGELKFWSSFLRCDSNFTLGIFFCFCFCYFFINTWA